jgi:diaminopimelate decarboxylase
MNSNYNTRLRAAELMINGEQVTVVQRRETIDEGIGNRELAL